MNTRNTKEFFEEIGVVALRADKGVIPVEVEVKLKELGNPHQAIPFYAIYGPALTEPITLEGPISRGQVASAIEAAKGGVVTPQIADAGLEDRQQYTRSPLEKLQTE